MDAGLDVFEWDAVIGELVCGCCVVVWLCVLLCFFFFVFFVVFFFQAEDGIRDLVRSRGLGDVYKGQRLDVPSDIPFPEGDSPDARRKCMFVCIRHRPIQALGDVSFLLHELRGTRIRRPRPIFPAALRTTIAAAVNDPLVDCLLYPSDAADDPLLSHVVCHRHI